MIILFEDNLRDSLKYLNVDTGFLSDEIKAKLKDFLGDFQIDEEHKSITDYIAASLKENRVEDLREDVLRAANLRKFLG